MIKFSTTLKSLRMSNATRFVSFYSFQLLSQANFSFRLRFTALLIVFGMCFTQVRGQSTTEYLISGTSWTAPAGVYSVTVECWGGGGGGGAARNTGVSGSRCASGGGGGGYTSRVFTVTPGTSYTYSVGAGGTAGATSGGTGGTGGSSTFTVAGTTITAPGGGGGPGTSGSGNGNAGAGGTGGTGTGGTTNKKGGNGGTAAGNGAGGGGGAGTTDGGAGSHAAAGTGGSGNPNGAGGGINNSGSDGDPGFLFGGGGSGARAGALGDRPGGAGALGGIRLTYCVSPTSVSAGTDVTICNGSSISLAGSATAPTTLFTENFESCPNNYFVYGRWAQYILTDGYNDWIYSSTSPITGSRSLTIYDGLNAVLKSYDIGGSNEVVAYYTSKINATGYTALKLNFKWQCYGESGYDYGRVCYSTNGTTWTDFSATNYQLRSATQTVTNLDISAVNNTQFYIGFRFKNDASSGSNPPFTIDDISITGTPPTPTYSWTPSTGLSATNVANPTASPTTTTTYTLTATHNSCSAPTKSVTVNVNTLSGDPTSITGPGGITTIEICNGGSTTLTVSGGTNGTGAVDVWYAGACGAEAYSEVWNSQSYTAYSTTVNSTTGGILNVTSTSGDPMIEMYSRGSFDPTIYKYINVRYKVNSGTAGNCEIFFTNSTFSVATGINDYANGALITDGQWHILSIDMAASNASANGIPLANNYWNGTNKSGNVTGWRFDWATNSGVTMDIDFITLTDIPMIDGNGAGSITVSPTSTTTYYTAKKGSCNTTSCISKSVTVNARPTVALSNTVDGCNGGQLATVTFTGGTSPYNFTLGGTGYTNQTSPFSTPATSEVSYSLSSVTDSKGCTASSITGSFTTPTLALTTGGTKTCTLADGFDDWIYDNSGNVIAKITDAPTGNTLGSTTIVTTIDGTVQNDAGLTNNKQSYLQRHLQITPASSGAATVKLYLTNAEVSALNTASAANDNHTYFATFATDLSNVAITKYNGGSETPTSHSTTTVIPKSSITVTQNPTVKGAQMTDVWELSFAVSGFSGFYIHSMNPNNNPLPVTLLYLTATGVNNNYIQLDWATATEINNKGFEVERSIDGENFTKIGWVEGNGTTSQKVKYSYDDKDAIPNRIYYYRLKQIDNDGQFEYTYIVSAIIREERGFEISELVPNPAQNKVNIYVSTQTEQTVKLKLTDLLGQEVINKEWLIRNGTNSLDIDLTDIPSGTYSVTLISGNAYTSKKLVITK